MYSQNKEEGVINSLFGDSGRFLDVGAHDGKTFSNTLRLYERGWSGVLVEPSPASFAGLERQYKDKPRVDLVNAAVCKHNGEVTLFDSGGDAISSTSAAHKEKWEKGYNVKYKEIKVKAITWNALFEAYGTDFQFVNLDTESTNWELLKTFPFDLCHPMCMCVEYDDKKAQMENLLAKHEYRTVYTSGENIVMWRGGK